jgi:uroporphyrin-III C-methyltransferase/precorrin-2 dehydrogenase/sirohydrochlorin ferrochelatase/uroporphyrin-III C-methyltransferase
MTGSAAIQVHLVGAGPGDPELLTVKAYRLITSWAEVVVYDRLVPEAITDLIPKNVERVYAGKSCKKHTMTQDEINAELVKHAKLGKNTLRLKGGDPLVFGRGGEEALYMMEHGIIFEMTAGISAASGISNNLGIPLTHRGVANGVQFITGHQQNNEQPLLDWDMLAKEDMTLVIYMGLQNLDDICQNLIRSGLSENTPAVAIENGTTATERTCTGNIKELGKMIKAADFKPPTMVIIGKVVDVAKKLGTI